MDKPPIKSVAFSVSLARYVGYGKFVKFLFIQVAGSFGSDWHACDSANLPGTVD